MVKFLMVLDEKFVFVINSFLINEKGRNPYPQQRASVLLVMGQTLWEVFSRDLFRELISALLKPYSVVLLL